MAAHLNLRVGRPALEFADQPIPAGEPGVRLRNMGIRISIGGVVPEGAILCPESTVPPIPIKAKCLGMVRGQGWAGGPSRSDAQRPSRCTRSSDNQRLGWGEFKEAVHVRRLS